MTELLNSNIFEKAQQYKDKVIGKLMDKVDRKSSPSIMSQNKRGQHLSVDSSSRLSKLVDQETI
jgi:hypothetical protein